MQGDAADGGSVPSTVGKYTIGYSITAFIKSPQDIREVCDYLRILCGDFEVGVCVLVL